MNFSFGPINDWDDAYANSAHIPAGNAYYPRWTAAAAAFRATARADLGLAYGDGARARLDLFRPAETPRGLFVFVHGGYWMLSGREDWSHLAAGALARGWAAALPSYPLCPEAHIRDIVVACARAVETVAAQVAGPVILCGHSAGGHIVARLGCVGSPLAAEVRARVRAIAPISGLFDLRPLLRTAMNATLRLDARAAHDESPALLAPDPVIDFVALVGAQERPEFLRQSVVGAALWAGAGGRAQLRTLPERHHFNVIEDLETPDGALLSALLD